MTTSGSRALSDVSLNIAVSTTLATTATRRLYLGSADLMQRNLDKRVETLFPIEDPVLRTAIRTEVLYRELQDTVNSSILLPDGCYVHVRPEPGEPPFDCQAWFIAHPMLTPELEGPLNAIQQVHPHLHTVEA